MRAFEFLKESKDPVSNIIRNLDIVAKKADEDPDLLDIIDPTLDKLEQQVSALQAKTKNSPTESTVEEDQATESRIQNLQNNLVELKKALPSNHPTLMAMEKDLAELVGEIAQAEKTATQQGFNTGVALSRDVRAERKKKAVEISTRLGKPEGWANELLGKLNAYDDEKLIDDFLDVCLTDQGLTQNITKVSGVKKFNLKQIINPKLLGLWNNKQAFSGMLLIPFAEQTAGIGGGIGPGEALLAMLIPGAQRASPGDIMVGKDTWEIKAGSYSSPSKSTSAWLDSSPGKFTGPALRRVFNSSIADFIKPLLQKTVTIKGNKFRVSQALELADFRSNSFVYLRAVFSLFDKRQQIKVIDDLYSELFPSVMKKDAEFYKDMVARSTLAIADGDHTALAKTQAKGGMLEYALGNYNSPNFIIYNSTTNDILSISGKEGILKSIDDPSFNLAPSTITMGGSQKASPGVTLRTDDQEFLDKTFGFDRKRKRTTRSKTF